jgi:hypothetical protein
MRNPKVKLYPLDPIGNNEQGRTLSLPGTIQNRGMLSAFRYAGSVSGRHFHKGLVPEKDPEMLILLSGKAELFYQDLITHQSTTHQLSEPSLIHIYPYTWHELKAVTNIQFVEMNSLQSHEIDTFYQYD